MSGNWQTDNQQWYTNGGGWAGDSAGFDIPMDDADDGQPSNQQQDFSDYYGGGSKFFDKSANKSQLQPQKQNFYPSRNYFPSNNFAPAPNNASYWSSLSTNNGEGTTSEDDRPLLEELGINFGHIRQKTFAVLNPLITADMSVLNDNDLAGPLVFCLMFGFSLLLHGKLQFGYIYGIGMLGCLCIYALLNLMSADGITLTCAVSVLGYCLLPMALLSLVAAVFSFKGTVGLVISMAAVLWCSLSASKLFTTALTMDNQRILVAYPCSLFYGVFALLAVY